MVQECSVDLLKVRIYEDRQRSGEDMARRVVDTIKLLSAGKDEVNIIFAAAPSQNDFLDGLSKEKEVDWSRINAFHMDEYVGLNEDAPQGFGNFLKERLFAKLPFRAVHYLNGNATNLNAECQRYADLLRQYPVDIVCMGIGENTHIAFNDPHVADFQDPQLVKAVDLDDACRRQQVNDGCFKSTGDVPVHALTLTVPALLAADHIFCMVPGTNKAEAVQFTLTAAISEKYPSTILRKHANSILFLDQDSAVKIVDECFKPRQKKEI
ncbi:glucosamine-6-phosphate deaminase [Flavitalea flava]